MQLLGSNFMSTLNIILNYTLRKYKKMMKTLGEGIGDREVVFFVGAHV